MKLEGYYIHKLPPPCSSQNHLIPTPQAFNKLFGLQGPLFGGPFKRRLIKSEE